MKIFIAFLVLGLTAFSFAQRVEEEIPEYEEETDDVIDDENDLKTTDDDEIEEQDEVEDPKKKRGWLCFYCRLIKNAWRRRRCYAKCRRLLLCIRRRLSCLRRCGWKRLWCRRLCIRRYRCIRYG